MDTTQVSQPLAELSTNTHRAGPTQETVKNDIPSVDCHPKKEYVSKSLQNLPIQSIRDSSMMMLTIPIRASYASPSDEIMSPCTKKLSDLKGKRFKKYGTPTSATRGLSPGLCVDLNLTHHANILPS